LVFLSDRLVKESNLLKAKTAQFWTVLALIFSFTPHQFFGGGLFPTHNSYREPFSIYLRARKKRKGEEKWKFAFEVQHPYEI